MIFKYFFQTMLLPLRLFYVLYHRLTNLKKNYIVQIRIEGNINEKPPKSGFLQSMDKTTKFYDIMLELYSFYSLLKKETSNFRKKQTLLINIHSNTLGWSQIWELQQIIYKIKQLDIFVVSYLYESSIQSYFLALSSTKIYVSPAFSLFLSGIRKDLFFFKDTFEKFGITANFINLGKYKSAVEKYTRNKASKFARTQLETIFNYINSSIQSQIIHHRTSIEQSSLNKIANKNLITAKEAHKIGLIDDIIYPKQIINILQERQALKKHSKPISLKKVNKALQSRTKKLYNTAKKIKIALVVGEGTIIDSTKETDNAITYPTYKKVFSQLRNSNFDAIILRWNSPGGSAFTSDLIWNEIMSFQKKEFHDQMLSIQAKKYPPKKKNTHKKSSKTTRKIYISQSNVAASGGYYLSAINKLVYATPFTITGSIGVLMGKFNIQPMLKKAFSTNIDSIETDTSSNIFSPLHNFDTIQKETILDSMQEMYTLFCHRIATGRDMNDKTIRELGEGKVYHGNEALKNGLVDYEGGLINILEDIQKEAKLANCTLSIKILPKIKKKLFDKNQMIPSFAQKYIQYKKLENQILYLDEDLFNLF